MGMMLLRIKLNFHAYNALVYPIRFQFPFILNSKNISINGALLQENNDQAFPVSR